MEKWGLQLEYGKQEPKHPRGGCFTFLPKHFMFPCDDEHKKLFFIKFNKISKKYDAEFTMQARVITDLGNS